MYHGIVRATVASVRMTLEHGMQFRDTKKSFLNTKPLIKRLDMFGRQKRLQTS